MSDWNLPPKDRTQPGESSKDIGAGIEYVKREPGMALSVLKWLWGFVAALISPRRPQ